MKKHLLVTSILAIFLSITFQLSAQVGINTDGSQPDPSAGLDVKFSNKGFLLPRMTVEQRNSIPSPAEGLMIYCTNCGSNGSLSIYSNGTWKTFSPCSISAPLSGTNVVSPGQIIWKWNGVSDAIGYKWNTINVFSSATDIGTELSKTETGIVCNSGYLRYVWSYNTCSISDPTTLTETIPNTAPAPPTSGTNIPALIQIIWKWNTVSGATGYKWNTSNDYLTATDIGTNTTITETGLTCSTVYTRYIWAYNGCGSSTLLSMTQSTSNCCVSSITINHVAGTVAPVTKTVTYGIVGNIPGATTKCWITRNLGATNQATLVSDPSETSAGWYWQFNHKQGFRHDGTVRTPATTWIVGISESSDWVAANDPCTIELGSNWRIPTSSEWINVDASGGWTTWTGPWNSALKMHAAGYLYDLNGSLTNRGSVGIYWSSTQFDATIGWGLYFDSSSSGLAYNGYKSYGLSTRCIKD